LRLKGFDPAKIALTYIPGDLHGGGVDGKGAGQVKPIRLKILEMMAEGAKDELAASEEDFASSVEETREGEGY
jgi:hypothetical protein